MMIKKVLKTILFPFTWLWISAMQLYVRFKGRDAARNRAIKKALRRHRKTGKRYRVFFIQNRYQVMTRRDIQRKKHSGEWGTHVNSTNIDPMKFFDTENLKNQ